MNRKMDMDVKRASNGYQMEDKKMKNNARMTIKKYVGAMALAVAMFVGGFVTAATSMSSAYADEMSASTEQELLNMITDDDMNSIISKMDPAILTATLQELPGSYSAQALVSVYLKNDPAFVDVLREYFGE